YVSHLNLFQTTISGNTADEGGGDGLYMGGYIAPASKGQGNVHGQGVHGQGVHAQAANSTVISTGTIIAGNADGTDAITTAEAPPLQADPSVLGHIGTDIQLDDQGGNQLNVTDPGLDPLASNGGPTQTMALKDTSVAKDAGPDPVPTFPGNTFDQRGPGFDRVV